MRTDTSRLWIVAHARLRSVILSSPFRSVKLLIADDMRNGRQMKVLMKVLGTFCKATEACSRQLSALHTFWV